MLNAVEITMIGRLGAGGTIMSVSVANRGLLGRRRVPMASIRMRPNDELEHEQERAQNGKDGFRPHPLRGNMLIGA